VNVVTAYDGPSASVHVEGRLDAEWATDLAGTLDELLRSGVRSAVVDLSAVSFVSSAGARVLTTSAKEFAALRGELLVSNPPRVVVDALVDAGLEDRVVLPAHASPDGQLSVSGAFDARSRATQDWRAASTVVVGGRYETSTQTSGAALTCRLYGDPTRARRSGTVVAAEDCRPVEFPPRVFGLGIGALGDDFEECGPRLGELVGVAGVAAYLPTDGAHVADYLTTLRGHAPRALVVSAIVCDGSFSHLIRFSAVGGGAPIPISGLADVCLDAVDADMAGVVMVAETAGLVGAYRTRPPTSIAGAATFAPAALRDWLSFTAQPAHAGTTALVAGVIARNPPPPLDAHVRPLRGDHGLLGHFHAAVFPYHPVPQRTVAVQPVVANLFEERSLRAVLHLVADRRPATGAGESRFVRGLMWVAPITAVTAPAE
jgi:anti-anti-sigma factor